MKKFSTVIVLAMIISLAFQACDNSKSTEPIPEPDLGTFTATVDGKPYKAMLATAVKEEGAIAITGVIINGTRTEGIVIGLTNYRLGENDASCLYSIVEGQTPVSFWGDILTKISITKLTETEISGTFNFSGTDYYDGFKKKEAINGFFRVAITKPEDIR